MERVAFLIEKTGEQIECLLNPESLVQRRWAGLRSVAGATGSITGLNLSDDPVRATGGGVTEYDLDLLFDVDLAREDAAAGAGGMPNIALPEDEGENVEAAGAPLLAPLPTVSTDVRELTHPFWALAENASDDSYGAPPFVRLIWGRAWNIPGVVMAVAEKLERFSESGVPRRSWLRMRLRRVAEATAGPAVREPATPQFELPVGDFNLGTEVRSVAMTVAEDGMPVSRLDLVASEFYRDPGAWRLIASANDIDNPLDLAEGTVLALPGIGPAAS